MSSSTDFETYARDCVKLAEQPDAPPELREQLLQMAREWMQAMMEAEDESSLKAMPSPSRCSERRTVKSGRVQRYLDNAEKCECKAEEAVDAHTKKIFLECVYQWHQLARQVED